MKFLKCDFHIHTKFSDGKLTIPEVVDLYGQHGFDAIAITDHFFDSRTPEGLFAKKIAKKSLDEKKLAGYYEVIENASKYAREKYDMIVIPGIEVCFAYRYHILALGMKEPMKSAYIRRDPKKTFKKLRELGCEMIIACHPVYKKDKNRAVRLLRRALQERYLWKHRKKIAPLIDAWEIANRYDLFNDIGLEFFPFVANSDFHKPQDIYSWKTLVEAEPNLPSIKEA
ncbi:MAG: PHP domain-containing protein, partial [bacterium]|nr:PHP domain-containing protein [bacterium]